MPDVFISYSKEHDFVEDLGNLLKQAGFDPWYYTDPKSGTKPSLGKWSQIFLAIEDAINFIFLINEFSLRSKDCRTELMKAHRMNKNIIPVNLVQDLNHKQELYAAYLELFSILCEGDDDPIFLDMRNSSEPDALSIEVTNFAQLIGVLRIGMVYSDEAKTADREVLTTLFDLLDEVNIWSIKAKAVFEGSISKKQWQALSYYIGNRSKPENMIINQAIRHALKLFDAKFISMRNEIHRCYVYNDSVREGWIWDYNPDLNESIDPLIIERVYEAYSNLVKEIKTVFPKFFSDRETASASVNELIAHQVETIRGEEKE